MFINYVCLDCFGEWRSTNTNNDNLRNFQLLHNALMVKFGPAALKSLLVFSVYYVFGTGAYKF